MDATDAAVLPVGMSNDPLRLQRAGFREDLLGGRVHRSELTPRGRLENRSRNCREHLDQRQSAGSFACALDTWGTEIPVVFINEQSTAPVVLLDIPTSDRFRVMLRMYDLGVEANEFIVDIRPLNGDEILHQARIPSSILTSIGGSPMGIWFAALTLSDWPSGSPERVRVTISNVNEAKLWAFATVTNNETQHITVVSPARVGQSER
jgi:hypothetical protein